MANLTLQNKLGLFGLSQSAMNVQSILDVFVLQNIIDPQDAEKLKKNFKTNREIENFLLKNRLVTQDTINKAYSIILKLPYIGLLNVQIPQEAIDIIPENLAKKYGIIAFDFKDSKLLKIAISKPSDLLAGYPAGLTKVLEREGLVLELFITGADDIRQALLQYDKKKQPKLLMKQGSLPVINLRNDKIANKFLKKIPKEYIEKYRMVIFEQNMLGEYLIACEQPDTVATKKVLDYLQKENKISLEQFATSKEDIDYVLEHYDNENSNSENSDIQPEIKKANTETGFFGNLFGQNGKENQNDASDSTEIKADAVSAAPPLAPKIDEKKEPETTSDQKNSESAQLPKQESAKEIDAEENDEANLSEGTSQAANLGLLLDKDVKTVEDLEEVAKSYNIPKTVAAIINYALNNRISDVHIEPQGKVLRVRCRKDGILIDVLKLPLRLHPPIISRIKIISQLKIDETRIPQDGRFEVALLSRIADVRVSCLPTVHGEKIVLRILDKSQKILSLEDLGMMGTAFDKTMEAITKPWGIILSTGPTGSGKSTTLNAIINRLNIPGVNIVTLEDPVEYETPGVIQCQVKPDIGFTFASGLRSVLRQDPNIIMVGEIRDGETAGMATQSALTGHLVLSTLHTNDTAGALPRLINMGVEPFLITSSINLIIAQRLVRLICPKCKEEVKIPEQLIDEIKEDLNKIPQNNTKDRSRIPADLKFFAGRGCDECTHGYNGRIGLFEAMTMSPEIEDLTIAKKSSNEIKASSIKDGMITMKQDGILKVLAGLTTIDEVLQATVDR